jgi:hypothetical protein
METHKFVSQFARYFEIELVDKTLGKSGPSGSHFKLLGEVKGSILEPV